MLLIQLHRQPSFLWVEGFGPTASSPARPRCGQAGLGPLSDQIPFKLG